MSISARDSARSAPSRASSRRLASGVICILPGANASRMTASRSRASSGKQATAAAAGDFSNSARSASSGRRLPASTIRHALQIAALDQRLQLRRRHAPPGDRAQHLAAAEHGRGLQLDEHAVGVFLEARIVEADDLARRVVARGQALGQLGRPLGHQACVAAVEQHGRRQAIERAQEGVGLVRLDGDHGYCM